LFNAHTENNVTVKTMLLIESHF